MLRHRVEQGDTIIEVLLAITVFSLVAVSAIAIMNRGVNTTQRALEITLVRQQIDSQVEALRAAHQAYPTLAVADRSDSRWKKIIDEAHHSPDTASIAGGGVCPEQSQLNGGGVFALSPTTSEMLSPKSITDEAAPPYAQAVKSDDGTTNVYGIWIERKRTKSQDASSTFPDAYDFRVRACWQAAGMTLDNPMWIETDVRLYDVAS